METVNIKFDEKQLDDMIKRVTENIIKKAEETKVTTIKYKEAKKKRTLMYLRANVSGIESEEKKVYFGYVYNTLSKESASKFNLDDEFDRKKVEKLKSQGWEEEVFYK